MVIMAIKSKLIQAYLTVSDEFSKCVKIKHNKHGFEAECKLGLWSVTAQSIEDVISEAERYFIQYKEDGEYSSIIGGKTVLEVVNDE